MKKIFAVSAMVLACAVMATHAQTYPATLNVPVTFYDFHSNGSNPDFEPGLRTPATCHGTNCVNSVAGLHLNEVGATLDAQRKPVLGTTPFFSNRIAKWFRPFQSGDYTVPIYTDAGVYLRDTTLATDASYINQIIPGTLVFNYTGTNGVYTYNSQNFFPLDGMGFGAETNSHNYSFTMELHWQFTYQKGLTFNFTGDDDVFVFINGRRVIDLGGIHGPTSASVNLDTLTTGNGIGQTDTLDLFYAERHVTGSDILITTNVISAPPTTISMTVVPNLDTLPAGALQTYTAHVLKSDGNECDVCNQNVQWTITPGPPGNQSYLTPVSGVGQTSTFNAVTAYTTNYLLATYDTVINGNLTHLIFRDTIYVKPDTANHITIQTDSIIRLHEGTPTNILQFSSTTLKDSVYTILWDRFGNFVRRDSVTTWLSLASGIASVADGRKPLGEGVITRQTPNPATTIIIASDRFMRDSIQVVLSNVNYSKINIVVRDSVRDSITSLQMRTDQDTTLYAMGLRADGSGIWDSIQVAWGVVGGLIFNNPAPPNASSWGFRPAAAVAGKIFISWGSGAQQVGDTITATFTYGLPKTMALYPSPGQPDVGTNTQYPATVTVIAGTPLPLVAKLFSQNNEWLNSYERKTAPFSWRIDELSAAINSGTLDTSFGYQVNFTGTKAYQFVRVTATFSENGIIISKAVIVSILPGPATKLVIEPDSIGKTFSPNSAHRADSVTIGQTSTTVSVYAVLRDAYNNFVRFSNPTIWLSRDTAQVKVASGNPTFGEGICQRDTTVGQAWVIAKDSAAPSLTDSVLIKLSNIYYTKLRIVVRDSTKIPVLGMTIDDDTLLKVQGFRSDGTGWDYIPAAWFITNNLTTIPSAPGSSITWHFTPGDTGTGWIKVNLPDTTAHAAPDSLRVIFSPGKVRNIVLYPAEGNPSLIQPYPGLTIAIQDSAGRSLPVVAKVFDKAGIWHSEYENASSPVTWTVVEFPANQSIPTGTLNPTTGDKTGFTAIKAFNTVYVIGTFSEAGNTYKDTIQVQTVPGPATHLVIEASPDSMVSRNADNRVGSITLGATVQKDSVYAVLRDANGNFAGHALLALWTSRNTGVVSVNAARTNLGEGEITRQTLASSNTYVAAQQGAMKDSVQVIVAPVGFSKIKIVVVVSANPDTGFKTLSMRTDQDTTLYALGLRNDGSNQWVPVTVSWGPGAGMTFVTNPKDSTAWNVQPTTPDTGYIKIVFGTLRDSVLAMFTYGNPTAMKLYPASGQPDVASNIAYKDTVTVVAGQPFPIYAKLFSTNQWLKGYERSDAPFTWNMDELTGAVNSGTLISAGSHSTFTGYKAYQNVRVTSTFSENGITLIKTIVISITPAAVSQLDIEPDSTGRTAYPNTPHRAGQVTMQSTDTAMAVYAVLRDPYGNFVSYSNPTTWQSRDTAKAGARGGTAAIGQGILIRKTDAGQTIVVATDGTHPAFKDSVTVVLSNISYTKLRIVTGDSTKITSLSLSIDQSQEIKVQGFRSDSAGWEYVNGKWGISGSAAATTSPPGASINWIVTPADTGSGWIKVTLGTATPDSITVHFTLGSPKYIVLYPAEGDPLTLQKYPDPGTAVSDSAGKAFPVVAKVFDKANNWLSSYETSISPVSWSIVELPGNTDMPTGAIVPSSGDKTALTATRAGNSVLVIAVFAQGTVMFSDSVKVTVAPGAPIHLVIEATDKNISPHKDNPDTLVQIPSSETYALVYAILRDAYGNFIKPSEHTAWLSLDSSVVTAASGGLVSLGQGQITRTPSAPRDRAQVTALSLDYAGLKDTTIAVVLKYYYLALRIVNPQLVPIDNLKMNTNQDTTLYVQGQRSTDGVWENTSAQWQSTGGLSIVPSAPGNASAWTFSPDKPGAGTIRVTSLNGDTMTTKPYHISVTFTVGPPTNVQIQILTPPDSLIAGDTIVSIVRISNKDGLVPDTFCTAGAYNNALGGLAGHDPVVITKDTTGKMTQSLPECFYNGVDTVRFVLYKAPMSADSLDKITVALNGLNASTAPFLMHPGDLARIAIEDFAGKNLDSVKLSYPTGSQLFLSVGYDAFGNKRGAENSTWSTDGTLHPVTNASNVSRVFYQSSQSIYDEAGYLIATATGKNGVIITDSAHVSITGPQTDLISAVTQDSSGNGYLDYIVIRFDKLVTITKEYPADSIVITAIGDDGKTYALTVDSIYGRSSSTDSVFIIKLTEPKKGDAAYGRPETDWKPLITMPAISGVSPVNAHPSSDGAGPVVWSVVKTISGGDPSNRASDLVTIVFSEPITTNGNNFNTSLAPVVVLHVWIQQTTPDGRDTMVERDTILSGINAFFQLGNNNTSLSFYMSNGNDLTSRDYISISVDTTGKALVADKNSPPNMPDFDNRKVQVVVSSQPPKEIKVAPNPSGPTFVRQPAGKMNLAFNPFARDWVRQDQSGVLLTFDVTPHIDLATNKIERVTGVLKILDMIGNVVFSLDSTSSRDGIIPPQWASADTSTFHFDMYWNGSNSKGMRAAPGIYRTVLYLKYEHEARPIKYIGTVGLTR